MCVNQCENRPTQTLDVCKEKGRTPKVGYVECASTNQPKTDKHNALSSCYGFLPLLSGRFRLDAGNPKGQMKCCEFLCIFILSEKQLMSALKCLNYQVPSFIEVFFLPCDTAILEESYMGEIVTFILNLLVRQ